MKLIALELKNFRQHLDTRVEFTDGVTGILGPNGAGKTTILEGIAWALYGSPAVRGTNDTLRARASEGGAKVVAKLDFELSGSTYRVTRTMDSSRGGSALLEVDGRPLRTGVTEVSEAVACLLGMDYRAFFTSFFTGQKQLEFMSQLDGRARAAMISRMLGYDRLLKARDKANEDRKGLAREIEGLQKGLADPEELKQRKKEAVETRSKAEAALKEAETALEAAQSELDRTRPLKEASEQKAKRFEEISRRIELDRSELKRLEERVAKLGEELKSFESARKELETMQPDLERYQKAGEEFKKLRELQKPEIERQKLMGLIKSVEEEVSRLDERIKKLTPARDRLTNAEITLRECEEQIVKLDERIQAAREKRAADERGLASAIEHAQAQLTQIERKKQSIIEAGPDGVCPTCERPLRDELGKVLAHFDEEAARLTKSISDHRASQAGLTNDTAALAALAADREKLAAQIEARRGEKSAAEADAAELTRISSDRSERVKEAERLREELEKLPSGFDEARFRELQRIGEELRPKWDRSIELRAELRREPEVRTELSELSETAARKKARGASDEAALAELAFNAEEHQKLVGEFEQAQARVNDANLEAEKRRGELKTAQTVLAGIEAEENRYKEKLEDLKSKRDTHLYLQTLAEAFDRFRNDLNGQIRPELEEVASELLAVITDGRYDTLEIDDNYEARVRDDGEPKPVISGGEEDVVNLALRLAISQMIADRAGQSFSLLVLDEVFGSLDEARRDNVVALLQNLKNRFEQIILITHVESIHDALDNCLWVQFNERTKTSRLAERVEEPNLLAAGVE